MGGYWRGWSGGPGPVKSGSAGAYAEWSGGPNEVGSVGGRSGSGVAEWREPE
jgi:hypothetical protein